MGKYETHVADRLCEVEQWAAEGLSNAAIARRLGIASSTLVRYIRQYPTLGAALHKGRSPDKEVEQALFRRAVGYEYEEERMEEADAKKKRVVVRKHVAPDITAAVYWLKNRMPGRWQDRPAGGDKKVKEDNFLDALGIVAQEVWQTESEADADEP